MQKKLIVFSVAAALLLNAVGAAAQEPERKTFVIAPPAIEEDILIAQTPGAPMPPPQVEIRGDNAIFFATEMSFGGKLVKGAPYSAQAVTESVQALADGNRIVRKNTAQVYRDAEGRTRREQTFGHFGPYMPSGEQTQTVFINDPVAGVHYVLDSSSKTARKLPRVEVRFRSEEGAAAGERRKVTRETFERVEIERSLSRHTGPEGAPGTAVIVSTTPGEGGPFMRHSSKHEAKTEKLEARSFDGVTAEGTRTTVTIPAGEIGNEQPIQIVDERWYSQELQVVVMTRHSDPRFGETTYRLTNISRAEPAAALFQVPSDYTVKEGGGPGTRRTFRRAAPPPPQEN